MHGRTVRSLKILAHGTKMLRPETTQRRPRDSNGTKHEQHHGTCQSKCHKKGSDYKLDRVHQLVCIDGTNLQQINHRQIRSWNWSNDPLFFFFYIQLQEGCQVFYTSAAFGYLNTIRENNPGQDYGNISSHMALSWCGLKRSELRAKVTCSRRWAAQDIQSTCLWSWTTDRRKKHKQVVWLRAQDPRVHPYPWNLQARQILALGIVIFCDFPSCQLETKTNIMTVRDYSNWVGWETWWTDPDLARILKWLTVAFRENCPDRIRGFATREVVWLWRFRQASCARMRVLEVDRDRVSLSGWACEVCDIRRLGEKRG